MIEKHIKRRLSIFAYGMMWMFAFLILYSVAQQDHADFGKWKKENLIDFGQKWTCTLEGKNAEIDVPVSLGDTNGKETIISKQLPDQIKVGDRLFTATCHTALQAYVNGELIYQYGQAEDSILQVPANALHTIPLKIEYEKQEIKLIFTSEGSTYMGKVDHIFYGDEISFLVDYCKANFFSFVLCFLILGLAVFLFVIWIAARNVVKQNEFLYLSLFSFNMFVWTVTETYLPQIFIGHTALFTVLAFEALALLPVPLLLLLKEDARDPLNKIAGILFGTTIVVFGICNLLFLGKTMDFSQSIRIIHLNILACAASILWVSIKEGKEQKDDEEAKQRKKRLGTWGFLFMICTAIVDIVGYYISANTSSYNFIKIGLLIYILTFSIDAVRNGFQLVILGEKAAEYEDLAYRDMLTGVSNRAAYKEAMQKLDEDVKQRLNTIIVIIDINNLKMVNDAMGHAVGDRYILSNVELIRKHFERLGTIYRIGGDEFVVLITNGNNDRFRWALHKMEQDVDSDGVSNFAFGYAYFEVEDGSLQNTAKRADKLMYQKKQKQKQKRE